MYPAIIILMLITVILLISCKENVPDCFETSAVTKPFYKSGIFLYKIMFSSTHRNTHYYRKLSDINSALHPGGKTDRDTAVFLIKKISLCLLMIFFGMGLVIVIDISSKNESVLKEGHLIKRDDINGKDYKVFLNVTADSEELGNIEIEIESRHYTDEELDELLPAFKKDLEKNFLGENDSLDFICHDVVFADSIEGYPFNVSYEWNDKETIKRSGEISDEGSDNGKIITIDALIKYDDYSVIYTFAANVFPKDYSKTEYLTKLINENISETNEKTKNDDYLSLPTDIDGIKVVWTEEKQNNALVFFVMTIVAAVCLFIGSDRDLYKKLDKKDVQMTDDYPEIVSKLTLYTGAGMSIRNAWKKIATDYKSQKDNGLPERYAYEEMLCTLYEMESGTEESVCYSHFSRRARVQKYVKLVSLLDQSLKTGQKNLCTILRSECNDAFEERKNQAEKKGEEAGTKLLAPMMMMLLVVMVIIMVPAFTSM